MSRPSILSCDKGLTLLELLVASVVSLGVVGMSIALTLGTQELFHYDQTRVELNQNLRGALDVVGIDVREGGEHLNSTFPAVQINNNANGTTDELILRRNLMEAVLIVCRNIPVGSSASKIYLNLTGSVVAACAAGAQAANIAQWTTYRGAHGGSVLVYIFDQATRNGEFFTYNNELTVGPDTYLQSTGHTFTNAYTGGATSVYVLEERKYSLQNGLLQLIQNNDTTHPYDVVFGLTDFQATAYMQDGTTKTTFLKTDDWSTIQTIETKLVGSMQITGKSGTLQGKNITRTLTARFFPRNILSN